MYQKMKIHWKEDNIYSRIVILLKKKKRFKNYGFVKKKKEEAPLTLKYNKKMN